MSTLPDVPRPFSVPQLAHRWGCSEGLVRKMIREGRLHCFRPGTLIRISAAEVERFECQQQQMMTHSASSASEAGSWQIFCTPILAGGGMTDLIHNSHAGELLVSEFLVPELARFLAIDADELLAVVAGEKPMSPELDARLCEHFCMSKGFFLRLQDAYEAMEVGRAALQARGYQVSKIGEAGE